MNFDDLLDIQKRIDNGEDFSEEEGLAYISVAFGMSREHLEARLARLRGERLLELGFELPVEDPAFELDEDDEDE